MKPKLIKLKKRTKDDQIRYWQEKWREANNKLNALRVALNALGFPLSIDIIDESEAK